VGYWDGDVYALDAEMGKGLMTKVLPIVEGQSPTIRRENLRQMTNRLAKLEGRPLGRTNGETICQWRFKLGEPGDKVPLPLLLALQTD